MILHSVRVQNFKCVNDSTFFKVDEKVTYLVGKNESGKTTLLQAISKLNPVEPATGEFTILEYPRSRMVAYQQRSESQHDEVLTTIWLLSQDDVADLAEILGPAAEGISRVEVSKGYSNETVWKLEVDEEAVVRHLVAVHNLDRDEQRPVEGAQTVQELHRRLSELETRTDRQYALLVYVISNFQDYSVDLTARNRLQSRLPKISHFTEYMRMPGQISINDLKWRQENDALEDGHRVFLALLDMIGRGVDDLEQIEQHEMLTAELEGASNRLTSEFFNYWSQDQNLRVQFSLQRALPGDPPPFNEGWVIRTRIQDPRREYSTTFDERSAGFVWFFSFLVWFSQIRRQYGEHLVVLLDDPGLSLHARGQADLLRYIEERLAPSYQVMLTTHSPFMIDASKLYRARTVEKVAADTTAGQPQPSEAALGTKVGDEVLSSDPDTLFPLQAALAYEISQPLFVGEHSLLVEGPSEILYFQWFKRKLASLGRTTLDDQWVVTPCGGIDKIAAFLSLFTPNKLHIAVVTSTLSGGKALGLDPRGSGLLRQGHVLTMDDYARQGDAGIEDVIGRGAYLSLVQQAYDLSPEQMNTLGKPGKDPGPLVKEMEQLFTTLPQQGPKFERYRPAEFLIQQSMEFDLPDFGRALDGFEALFRDLNAMLY